MDPKTQRRVDELARGLHLAQRTSSAAVARFVARVPPELLPAVRAAEQRLPARPPRDPSPDEIDRLVQGLRRAMAHGPAEATRYLSTAAPHYIMAIVVNTLPKDEFDSLFRSVIVYSAINNISVGGFESLESLFYGRHPLQRKL